MGLDRTRGRGVTWRTGRTRPARKQALLSSLAFPAIITIIVGMSGGRTNIFRSSGSKAGLDRMDVTILGLLQNNARLSVREMAAEVALAPSSTHERIKRIASFPRA